MSFDLADALECPLADEKLPQISCCKMTQVDKSDTIRIEDGLDLVISENPKTFQCNAVLLLAVNRLKKSLGRDGKTLGGNELCSNIFGCLVEETIVKTTVNWASKAQNFQRANSLTQCTLSDMFRKSLVLKSGQVTLQAILLKGGSDDYKVNFTLSRYRTETMSGGLPVLLSISGYHLSCSMKGDKAELSLEPSPQEDLSAINEEANKHRFLFWKRSEEPELKRFESVSCPGWFISTSPESGKPVDMCRADDTRNYSLRAE